MPDKVWDECVHALASDDEVKREALYWRAVCYTNTRPNQNLAGGQQKPLNSLRTQRR